MKLDKSLQSFFTGLGFTNEEISVYLALSSKGTLTVLELSRATAISRTQIYRILELMKDKGIVEETIDEHRKLFKAIGLDGLNRLILEKQQTVDAIKSLFPIVTHSLTQTEQIDTHVQFYRGKAGIRQMVWHTLRAKGEITGFTYRTLSEFIGVDFTRDWIEAFISKGLKLRDIYSDSLIQSKKLESTVIEYPEKYFPSRYLSPEILDISIQTDFYNDVSAFYTWKDNEVFGVEIYNPTLSAFHKQLFEIVWKMADPEKN